MTTSRHLYWIWAAMRQRCYNPRNKSYPNYGGRGITVDPRWKTLFSRFAEDIQTLGPRPTGYTLDRIDNDGPYTLTNVRWADRRTQTHNTRVRHDNKTGVRGMYRRGVRWCVSCWVNGTRHYRSFLSQVEATAYLESLRA